MVNTERIKKLLNLTTSTFNGEALNAIRKANEELKKNDQTWDEVFKLKKHTQSEFDESSYLSQINYYKQRLQNEKDLSQEFSEKIDELEDDIIKYGKKLDERDFQIEDLKRACDIYKFASGTKKGDNKPKSKKEDQYKETIRNIWKQINTLPYKSKERSRLYDELDRLKSQSFK